MNLLIVLYTICLCSVYRVAAQFAFSADDTDANAIYSDILGMWGDWALFGNQVLSSAHSDYPDAFNQLTGIFGTTHLPDNADEKLARRAADILAQVHHTTVWDKNAGDHSDYSFKVEDLGSGGSVPPTPTSGATGTATMTDTPKSSPTPASTDDSGSESSMSGETTHTGSTATRLLVPVLPLLMVLATSVFYFVG